MIWTKFANYLVQQTQIMTELSISKVIWVVCLFVLYASCKSYFRPRNHMFCNKGITFYCAHHASILFFFWTMNLLRDWEFKKKSIEFVSNIMMNEWLLREQYRRMNWNHKSNVIMWNDVFIICTLLYYTFIFPCDEYKNFFLPFMQNLLHHRYRQLYLKRSEERMRKEKMSGHNIE